MSVDPKIAKSEMDNLDAALKKGAVTKSKAPSAAAAPSGTGNELADIDVLLKKKGVSSSSLSGGLSTGTEDLVESGNIEPKSEGDLSGGLGKGKKTEGKGLFEFMNNPTAVPKLPTEKINVQDFVRKQAAQLKADIAEGGKLIDPEVVKSVRDNDPETFKEIVSAVLPKSIVKNGKAIAFKAFPDEYLKSGAIINAIVGNVNDAANYNSFNKTFKEAAGVDYSPEEAAKLSPAKRIQIGIAEPGDFEKARTEIFKEDLDQNFPKEKVPFGLEEVIGTQDKYKNEILSSPEKMAEYAVRRQQEEQQKINNISAKLVHAKQFIPGGSGNRDAAKVPDLLFERNNLSLKLQDLKDLAAKTITESVKQNYLKENGITDPNSPQAIELLNTEKAWKNIGYNVAMKSDANLALHLEDIEAALADRRNNVQYSGGTGGGSQMPVTPDLTQLPTDWESRFKRLSESGNDIIQAQLINKGYTALIANLKENGKFAEANQLISKADEVAVLTGKAASGELWARLSAARFKKYGETIGRRDGWGIGASSDSPDKIRELAKLANFSTIDNAILEKYMIPDEFSGLGLLSNLQTSGFIDNTLEAIGGTLASVKNMFRDNADRTREILNDKSGKLADVGEYTPFLMELEQLGAKKSLTPQEAARKQLLTENTNLMNWWQQFKSVSGNTTGQVLGIALSAKGLDKVFKMAAYATMGSEAAAVAKTAEAGAGAFEKSATNIAENIFNQPSFAQKAAKYINNQKSLYISSFANSFDNYKKESLQLMPGAKNEGKRMVYSTMMATAEGLSESIFDDRKVLNAFGKEISPVVTSIVNDLSHGTLNKVAALSKLESVLRKDQFLPFIKKMVINAHGEAKEEFVMDVVPDIAKAILLDQDYDFVQSIAEGFKTYQTMFIGGLLTAGMATRGDIRNNTFNKSSLYRIANSPAEYHDEINRLTISGDITPQQAQVKHAMVNAASGIFSNMVKDGVVKKNGMNDAKNNAYLLHTLNENVNTVKAKATNDEIVKKPFLDAAVRSHAIREGIYNGMINVDEFINPTTPDEKLAEKLDIDFVPDQTELTQQEQAAIEGFKGVDFGKGGITNLTDVIQSETASSGQKRQALTELKEQLSDKNSEIATGWALGKAADFIYDLIDEKGEPEEISLPIELSTETPTQQLGKDGVVDEGVGTRLRTEDEVKRIKQRNQKLIDNNNKIVELTGKDNAGEALDALGELYRSKVDEANANAKKRYKEGMSIEEKDKIVDEEFEKSGVGEIDRLINHLNDTNDTNSFKTTSLTQEAKDIQKESDEAHTKKVRVKSEQSLSTPKAEPSITPIEEVKGKELGSEGSAKLETDKAVMEGVETDYIENEDGDKIRLPQNGFLIDAVYLKDGQQKGVGNGQELYKKALDKHSVLYSHFPISEDAMRVQDKLVEKGIAKIEIITLSDGTELRKIQSLKETTKAGSVGVGGDALKDIESITNALVDKFKSDISPSKKMSREEFVEKDFESAKEDMVKRGNWTGFNREQVIKNYNKNLKAAKEGKPFDNFLFEEVYNNGYIGAQAELNVRAKNMAEAYHKAKSDGSNPELVKEVEDLIGEQSLKETTKAETPTPKGNTSNVGVVEGSGGVVDVVKVENILNIPTEEANVLSMLHESKVLTPNEKRILYKQYKSGVMNEKDVSKYTNIDVADLQNGNTKWAQVIADKTKGKEIKAEDIDFEELPTEQSLKETTKAETKEPKPKSAIEKLKEKKEAAAKEAAAAKPNVGVRNIKLKPQVELARVKDIDKLFAIAKNILDWKQDYKASGKSLNEYLVDKYNEAVAIPEEQRTDREQNIINAVEGKPIKKIKDEIIPKKQVAAGDTGKSDTESSEGTGEPKKIKTFKKRAKAKIKSPLFLKALDVDDTNPLIAALQYFISGGRIHYQALQKLFRGNTGEIKAHFQLVGKHGPRTTERLGEDLWDSATEEMQNKYDSTDFYNAVEQVLLEHNSRTTMAEEVLKISGESLEGEDKAAADWYNNQYEALPEEAQQELDNAIDLLQGLTDSEIQALVDADEEAFNNYIETESEKYTDQPTLEELMDDSEEVVQEQNNNEAEKEQIQKWLDDEYENNEDADIEEGHVSFDWDGEILEIFQGRNKPPLEFTKEELIEKGVFDTPEKAAEPEPETPLEPVDAAKDLIRAYVLRGDSLQSLKEGQLGSASSRYDAHIGGYANGKKIKSDQIAVTGINNKELPTAAIFSLKKLYDEIAKDTKEILQQHEAANQLSEYLDEIGTPSVNDKLDELYETLTNLRGELKGVIAIVPYKDGYIVSDGAYGTHQMVEKFSKTITDGIGFNYYSTYYWVNANDIPALKEVIKEGNRFGHGSFVETDKNFKVIEIYKSDGVVPKLNEISNPVEPVEPEGNGIKKAQLELDRANAALKKAEDKIAEKQAKQLDLLNPEPMQADLFANNGDEVKAVLEPLKQRVREAKAALADAEKLQQDSSQPELFGDIGIETLKVKKNEPNNVVLKTKYSFAEGSEFEHGFTFTGKLDVQETVDQSKPFAVGYFGDNNANRYERAVASNNINDIVSRMKDFDSQEGVVEIYNPNTKEKNSFTIYPFANTYTDETVGLNNDQKEQKVKDAEKSKKISEIEKAKQDKINEVTRPELDIKKVGEGFPITDLAKTTEANRQKYNDLVQKMYSLKELINCLWK